MQIESNADPRPSVTPAVTRPAPGTSRPARSVVVPVTEVPEKHAGPTMRYMMVGLLVIGVVTATTFAIARQQVDAPASGTTAVNASDTPKADPVQLNRLMAAVQANPNDFDSLTNLGDYYYQIGDYTNAASAYNHALTQQPDNLDTQESLGNAYLRSGDFARAVTMFDSVYKTDPTRASVAVALCVALIQEGGTHRAEGLALWAKVRDLPGLSDSDRQSFQSYMDRLINPTTPVATP